MRYSWSKNNKEQRDKPKGLPCVTGCKGEMKKGADGKWVAPSVLCPVHIGRHAKLLQSLDAGVSVEELKAPVFSKVARIGKVPSGATLVVDENERDAVLQQAGRLVLVITRKQEVEGLLYDGSMPLRLPAQRAQVSPATTRCLVCSSAQGVCCLCHGRRPRGLRIACASSCARPMRGARRRWCR